MILQNMFGALSFLRYQKDDDLVDRLSYFYTSSFLIMMAVLVSFKQFGGRPLECWVPAQFTSSWEAYTEMFCWSENTYFVPVDEDIPEDIAERDYRKISYYQWVPFFLLIQAFLFYGPCLIWRLMSDKSGIRLNDIVQMATEKENIEPEYSTNTQQPPEHSIPYIGYVTGMYLATKVFYVGNVLTNLLLVNKFLETNNYSIYGLGVLYDLLLLGKSWTQSGNFPRITLCDFEVRVLGNIQRHSVQCVLVINIFNEKIFILLWLWLSILFFITLFDGLYWFSVSLFHRDRFRFVLRHLELTSDPDRPELFRKEKRKQVEHFLKAYLKVDGVLVLRMIALHAGVMYCTEITDALWKRYLSQHPENLIDEDSVLINFARNQSIRRRIGCSASSTSLAPNQNGSSGGSAGRRVIQRNAHARLSRFLSYRQVPATAKNTRGGAVVYRPNIRANAPTSSGTSVVERGRIINQCVSPLSQSPIRGDRESSVEGGTGQQQTVAIISQSRLYDAPSGINTQVIVTPSSRPSSRQGETVTRLNRSNRRQSSSTSPPQIERSSKHKQLVSYDQDDSLSSSESLTQEHSFNKITKAIGVVKTPLKKLRSAMLPSSSAKSSAKNSTASDFPNSDKLSLTRCATSLAHPLEDSTQDSNHTRKISFSTVLDTHEEGKVTNSSNSKYVCREQVGINVDKNKKKIFVILLKKEALGPIPALLTAFNAASISNVCLLYSKLCFFLTKQVLIKIITFPNKENSAFK
ncbi:Innexin [Meloidogyne graminicola]|uniref:Innexin n=1 Tax=Meloidogyne graminicola TaxID=189291 RepID=A0A8S9ZGB8_9BILA|nr:Innexin [Meloidogyne graminicola]